MLFPRGLILITPKKLEGPGEELNFEQKLMVFAPHLRVIFGLPIPYLDNSDLIFWCI